MRRPVKCALTSFRRVTSSGRYLAEVDGLRFVAIFAVFVFHVRAYLNGKSSVAWRVPVADDWLGDLTLRGDYGVPLFFGISGFVLALPFAERHLRGGPPISLRSYYLRRLSRLEPPYLASLLLFFVLLVVVKHAPVQTLAPHVAASAIYLHGLIYAGPNVINVVNWSLEVEVQFYLLAPFLAMVFGIRSAWVRRTLLCVACYGVIAVQPWLVDGDARLKLTLAAALQYFIVGFFLADLYVSRWDGIPSSAIFWDAISIVAWPAMIVVCRMPPLARFLFPPLMLLFYVGAFRSRWIRRVLTMRVLTTIGGMCYATYLIHYQVISLAGRLTIRLAVTHDFWVNLVIQVFLLSVPVLLASSAFFLLLEKPCMRREWPAQLLVWLRARPSVSAGHQASP